MSYPIPKIDDENECISRFSEIFDDSIINQIAESDINYDWNYSGWRGFSFQNGLLWIDERFLIYKVNYLTKVADSLKREFLLNDKLALHESLRDFSKPKYLFGFNNYFGRIDELNDQTLRLVLWQKGTETQLTKPDIIAFTDEFIVEGTIRNESTIFKLTDFTYEFSFDSNYPEVTISKDGEVILNATLTIYSW
ncbi:hypothetical protein EP331_01405 [bacterium]|nr:MAG: hypothetical protein EP331_01405 [bacterium]